MGDPVIRMLQRDMLQFGLGQEQWRWKEYLGNKGDRTWRKTGWGRRRPSIKDDSLIHSHLCNTINSGTVHGDTGHTRRGLGCFAFGNKLKCLSTGCLWDKKQKYPIVTGCPELSKEMYIGHEILQFMGLQMIQHRDIKRKTEEEKKVRNKPWGRPIWRWRRLHKILGWKSQKGRKVKRQSGVTESKEVQRRPQENIKFCWTAECWWDGGEGRRFSEPGDRMEVTGNCNKNYLSKMIA